MDRGTPSPDSSPLRLDEAELARRRAFFDLGPEDLERLASLRDLARKHNDEITEALYRFILAFPENRAFVRDDAMLARLVRTQKEYFLGLVSGVCDLEYARDRRRVGEAHERIGLPLTLYVAAYAEYLRLVRERLAAELAPSALEPAYRSFQKIIFFDMAIAIDTYVAADREAVRRHAEAVRELSTPVIALFERVLLLPLVGTIDTHRAQQVMERLLVRIVADQARVAIIDIAGVPVVDTQVAESLIATTSAVRLVGAETVVTGLSPTIARTLVRLGMDLSALATRASLAQGIEHALRLVSCRIVKDAG